MVDLHLMWNEREKLAREVANNAAKDSFNGQDQMDLYIQTGGGRVVMTRDKRPIKKKRFGVVEPGQG